MAPIVLFVYNRLNHTKQTIQALQNNLFANESDLFIYSDAPKDIEVSESVYQVRKYIVTIDGFKSVSIIERKSNWGLAKSIIEGVTEIVNQYGRVIVLEDDIVTSPYFLKYMNEALEFYLHHTKIWHIAGWNYPVRLKVSTFDVFLWRMMNCWGWATWKNRWKYFEKNSKHLIDTFSKKDIKKFNIDNSFDLWSQVVANNEGKIDTWAIFWYATIFMNDGLCVNPIQTFVENIGLDGSGQNCPTDDVYVQALSDKREIIFSRNNREDSGCVRIIKFFLNKHYSKPTLQQIIYQKVRKILL